MTRRRLAAFIVFIGIGIVGGVYMIGSASSAYHWEVLGVFDHKVDSIEFVSPLKGWMSDFHVAGSAQSGKKPKLFSQYRQSIRRIRITKDGGRSWEVVHESPGRMLHLQYSREMKVLQGIEIQFNEGIEPPLDYDLYESSDEGRRWEKVCDLPNSTEGFRWLDEKRGYAWSLDKIYATSDKGWSWRQVASKQVVFTIRRSPCIGPDGMIYFIADGRAKGLNPWDSTSVTLALPDGLEPKEISASTSSNRVFVLGTNGHQWNMIAFDQDKQVTDTETIPIREKQFRPAFLADGGDAMTLVGTTLGTHFPAYHFYIRDSSGWHRESIPDEKNFERLACLGRSAWAVRISLLLGKRQLLRRQIAD